MRECVNCGEKIEDGEYCYEMPAPIGESRIGATFMNGERLFCEWCGGLIEYSRYSDGRIKNLAAISDMADMLPEFPDDEK